MSHNERDSGSYSDSGSVERGRTTSEVRVRTDCEAVTHSKRSQAPWGPPLGGAPAERAAVTLLKVVAVLLQYSCVVGALAVGAVLLRGA